VLWQRGTATVENPAHRAVPFGTLRIGLRQPNRVQSAVGMESQVGEQHPIFFRVKARIKQRNAIEVARRFTVARIGRKQQQAARRDNNGRRSRCSRSTWHVDRCSSRERGCANCSISDIR
jgi:hypothetical protein